jgi:hypothetical protein
MNSKIDVGLVFAIPLAERSFGFGQLIAWQHPIFYIAGYDLRSESPHAEEREVGSARPVLFGNFFDILIQNGRWQPIMQLDPPDTPFPCFKVKVGDKFYVETWDRRQMREATSEECASLQFRRNNSAMVLEDALKAYFGLRAWESKWFDSLRTEVVAKSSKVLFPKTVTRLT